MALLLSWQNDISASRDVLKRLQRAFPDSPFIATIEWQNILRELYPHHPYPHDSMDMKALLLQTKKSWLHDIKDNHDDANKNIHGLLCLAHAHVLKKDPAAAAAVLERIAAIAHSAGTVATLVSLYNEAGNGDAATAVVQAAVAYHTKNQTRMEPQKSRSAIALYQIQVHQRAKSIQIDSVERIMRIEKSSS
jgi:hypothetical protein